MSVLQFVDGYEAFIARTNRGLERVGIDRRELAMMDTICYRAATEASYKMILANLGNSTLVGQVMVSGRPIATIEFDEPLEADGWRVPYLELPAPKEGTPYPEGLEHAQFVTVGSLDKFEERHHRHVTFDRSGSRKVINPILGIKVPGLSAKFHEQPLGAVVRIENAVGVRNLT